MHKPTRKAVLIGSPGKGKKRLPGVPNDLVNMRAYLRSPRGGAWHPDEIETLDDPIALHLQCSIRDAVADYVFIYFSGHGYMDEWYNNLVCLKDSDLIDHDLFNMHSPRQLIIVDACRSFYYTISGIPEETEKWKYATGYSEARELFDSYIINSRPGKLILHSTSTGQPSVDDSNGMGGEFTLALLKSLFAEKAAYGHYPITVDRALGKTKQYLIASNEPQVPCVTFSEGDFEVPLGIASVNFIRVTELKRPPYFVPKPVSGNNKGIGAVVVLGLLLLLATDD